MRVFEEFNNNKLFILGWFNLIKFCLNGLYLVCCFISFYKLSLGIE